MLKDIHLVERQHRLEHRIRFMVAPSFLVSEGIGLHAQAVAFPGDEAQRWLMDAILVPLGIPADGSDFAGIHDARNALWGAWGNGAHLAAQGRYDTEIGDYLRRWGLLTEPETATALGLLRDPVMQIYVLGYDHGWRLLRPWLNGHDRRARMRRLLTEPVLPSDVSTE